MSDQDPPPKLADLDKRLRDAQTRRDRQKGPAAGDEPPKTAIGLAFRIGVELVSALVVSLAIGYGLDLWLGTGPWLLVVFFFAGGAAGVLNVYRAMNTLGLASGDPHPKDVEDQAQETKDDR